MNETENKLSVCAANCPLNRVITVHEIGHREHKYWNSHLDSFVGPLHLVEYKIVQCRHFPLHAIKEIGGFYLPVFEFKEKKNPGFSGWLGGSTVEYKKVKDVSGGWIRIDDDELICVSETYEELKSFIEGVGEKKEGNS